jgi:hypothetical protein
VDSLMKCLDLNEDGFIDKEEYEELKGLLI